MAPATISPIGESRSRPAPSRPRRRGFTLLETLLSVALVLVLAAVAVYGFTGWRRAAALNEGADRFATLLRAMRNEAPIAGRQLRLAFVSADGDAAAVTPEIQWQADPLGAGGQFVRYGGGLWDSGLPTGLVTVASCKLTGPSAYRTLSLETVDSRRDATHEPVTFYPDCSSDWATVILRSTYPADTRVGLLELNGLTGKVATTVLTAEEAEDVIGDLRLPISD